jgi:uncharacterized damage-inducible protein DinB
MQLDIASPVAQIANLLQQLESVVERLDDTQYRAERAREVSGSIGGHVRHCLDHVAALAAAIATGRVDYDSRVRGTSVERRRDAALAEIARLLRALPALHASMSSTCVDVVLSTNPDGRQITARSTLARELAFVANHTVHHFAVVALLLRDMGVGVPARFGYAPSTPSPGLAA